MPLIALNGKKAGQNIETEICDPKKNSDAVKSLKGFQESLDLAHQNIANSFSTTEEKNVATIISKNIIDNQAKSSAITKIGNNPLSIKPTATVKTSSTASSFVASPLFNNNSLVNIINNSNTNSISPNYSYTTVFDSINKRNQNIKQRIVSSVYTSPASFNNPTLATINNSTNAQRIHNISDINSLSSSSQILPTGRSMTIEEYPRPHLDNGRGMHWIPTLKSDKQTVDRFVQEMVDMKIKWAVFLNDNTQIGDNDYLVKQLVANGIKPIMRIYTHQGNPIQGDIGALVRHYKSLGVDYYQLYNEPNLKIENGGMVPNVDRYLDLWIPAAKAVIDAGGLPGFGSLAPAGDYDDIQFLKESLDGLKARNQISLLDRGWISLHNYTLNRPLDHTADSNGFLKFKWYDDIVRQKLGRSLPIIGTEGGSHIGSHNDKSLPPTTAEDQLQMVVGAYDYMKNAENYFFANTYWIIANKAGGGTDPEFEWQALFQQNGYVSPVVEALKKMPLNARNLPKASSVNIININSPSSKNPIFSPTIGQAIVNEAKKYLGYDYVWGGHDPSTGFDCTGLTWYVMKKLGKELSAFHDLAGQMASGPTIAKKDLQPGDFIFFKDTYKPGLSHVGIYIGENRFIHAASEKLGVIISDLNETYWASRYLNSTRPY